VWSIELRLSADSLDEILFTLVLVLPAGARRPTWVNAVRPLGPSGRTVIRKLGPDQSH